MHKMRFNLLSLLCANAKSTLLTALKSEKTSVIFNESKLKFDYSSKICFIGSCFSENISSQLYKRKFGVKSNPSGILFNPISIADCLSSLGGNKVFTSDDIFIDNTNNDIIHSYKHHSSYSNLLINKEAMLSHMNNDMMSFSVHLKESSVLFVTLGSAFAYQLKSSGTIVANCHKR